jgi:hypothetical protein
VWLADRVRSSGRCRWTKVARLEDHPSSADPDDYVRDVIHVPKMEWATPPQDRDRIREWICLIARTSPPSAASPASRPGRWPSCSAVFPERPP